MFVDAWYPTRRLSSENVPLREASLATTAEIKEEVERSALLTDYEAVDVLWVALLKIANKGAGNDEFREDEKSGQRLT